MAVGTCIPLTDLQPLFGLAVVLAFSVISLLYILGKILGRSEFEVIAKKEFTETIIAIGIALTIVGFAALACEFTKAVIQENAPGFTDQFTYSTEYLDRLIRMGQSSITEIWEIGFLLKSGKVEFAPAGIRFNIAELFSPIVTVLDRFASILFAPMIGSLQLQLLFLQIAQAFSMTIILPMGMILRAIPLTRKGGSFMMALAFGLYIVLPLMYSINYNITKDTLDDLSQGLIERRTIKADLEFGPIPGGKTVSDFINKIFIDLFFPFDKMALIIPHAVPLVVINFTITIGFINVFSNFLDQLR